MTINIQNAAYVTAIGHHSGKNSKAVYNITTGEFYASGLDAATKLEVEPTTVSAALNGRLKTCKGMRLCFVSKIMEYLEEINQVNIKRAERERINAEKIAAYDAIIAEQKAKEEALKKIEESKVKCAELRQQLEEETSRLEEMEASYGEMAV